MTAFVFFVRAEVAKTLNLSGGGGSDPAGRKSPRYETPPGTPPPPYPAAYHELSDNTHLVTWAGLLGSGGGGK